MWRAFRVSVMAWVLIGGVNTAQAEIWNGCIQVANTTDIPVTATVEGYSGSWTVAPKMEIKYLALTNGGEGFAHMQADSHGRPPIHLQPSAIGMIWNFFVGTAADENGCVNVWRIVVIRSPCSSVVDNICQDQ